jgi:ABC-type sugar transport system permease subunit/outer membrane protein assembly factor BamB
VYSTALSADGSVQVVGSRNNRAAAYDAHGNLLWEFTPGSTVWGVSTSEDGQWTAVASEDRNLYLLDAQGQEVWSYRSSRIFLDVAVSRDGSRIFASDEGRNVYFFDQASSKPLWEAGLRNISDSVAIYGGSTIRPIAGNRDSQVTLFSPEGDDLWTAALADDITSVAVSSNGRNVVVGTLDGKLTLLNGANAEVVWQIDLPNEVRCNARQSANCLHIDISGEGDRILAGTLNGDVYVIDSADGSVLQSQSAGAPVSSVSISKDGQTLLFATREGFVRSTNTAAAAAAFALAQATQRNLLIGVPLGALALLALGAVWVNRTATGRRFWNVTLHRPRTLAANMRKSWVAYALILPTVILLLLFNYYPAFSGLYHSFTEWQPGVETTWVGLRQFERMFASPYFGIGISNAVVLVLTTFAKLAVPLLVAELIFHIRSEPLQYAIRTFFIIPLIVPGVVGLLLWVNIYDPNIGLLNQTLNLLGLSDLTRSWLGDKATAFPAILFMGFPWVSPFALLIFYGGLISIPQELFDAARVDGATWWSRFWRIDLPLLMSQIKLLLILAFIGGMQEFQSIFLTTGGGPGNVTYTPALELYYQATRFNDFGLASAMGTALFLVILLGTILNLRYVRSQTEHEA